MTSDVPVNKTVIETVNSKETYQQAINNETEIVFNQRGLHVVNLNVRHLKPKMDDMKIMLGKSKCIDIFGVCETFLNQTVSDDLLNIDGYKFERKDRHEDRSNQTGRGGGILITCVTHAKKI